MKPEEIAERIADEVAPRVDSNVVDRVLVALRPGTEDDPSPIPELLDQGKDVYVFYVILVEAEDSGADRTIVAPAHLEAMVVDLADWAREEFEDAVVLPAGVLFAWKGGSYRRMLKKQGEDPNEMVIVEREATGVPPEA
ncbi:MAG: hypothetical protein GXO28_00470 [Methanopyri archaeon]|nr:hypothetical protein [Methanopyri archaeon]